MAAPKLDWEISVIYGEPTLNRSVSRRQAGLLDIHAEIPKRCEEFLEKFQVDLNRKCEEFRNEVFERPQITSKKTVKRRRGKRIKSETLGTSVMDLAKLKRSPMDSPEHIKAPTIKIDATCVSASKGAAPLERSLTKPSNPAVKEVAKRPTIRARPRSQPIKSKLITIEISESENDSVLDQKKISRFEELPPKKIAELPNLGDFFENPSQATVEKRNTVAEKSIDSTPKRDLQTNMCISMGKNRAEGVYCEIKTEVPDESFEIARPELIQPSSSVIQEMAKRITRCSTLADWKNYVFEID